MTSTSGTSPRATLQRRPRRRSTKQSPWWALLFVGPTALGLGVFYLWPTVRTVAMSFTDTGPFGGSEWVGLDQYRTLLQQDDLLQALGNSVVYTLIALIGIPVAVLAAVLLNTKGLRGRGVYRTLYFIPVVTMPAAVGIVWRLLYNGDYGIINQALGVVGIEGRSWLTDPNTALVAIAVVGIWSALGTNIVIFLACRASQGRWWRPRSSTAQDRRASCGRSRCRCSRRASSSCR